MAFLGLKGFTGQPKQFLTVTLFLVVFGLQLILGLWVMPVVLPGNFPVLALQALGSLIAGIGTALPLWAFAHFRRADTAVAPYSEPAQLVTGGPYRITRNPMYCGILLALLGFAIAINSLTALICAFVFPLAATPLVIRWEEAKLLQVFGNDYLSYRKKTPRWLIV